MDPESEAKPANQPTEAEIAAALKQHDDTTDRVAVIIKYPWLVPILNKRSLQATSK